MKISKLKVEQYILGYLLVLPAFLILILFFLIPLILGIISSFKDGSGLAGNFIGFKNYVYILTDPRFWNSLKVSIIFTTSFILISAGLGLILAIVLLNRPKFYKIHIAAIFIPYISTPVIGALVWSNMFSFPFGFINILLNKIGLNSIAWFQDPNLALIVVIFIQIWYTVGFNTVLFLSGLQAIPKSYLEAADLEGCTFFQKLFNIILPLIIPTTVFIITITTLYGFVNSYVLSSLITAGGPFEATNVVMSYIFELAFDRFDLGKANAVTMITFLLLLGLSFLQFRYQKKKFFGL